MKIWSLLLLLSLSSLGCQGLTLNEILNERNVSSCLWYQGSAGPYVSLTGVTATGGALLEDCIEARHP